MKACFLFSIISLLMTPAVVFPQWQQLNCSNQSDVQCFAVDSSSAGPDSTVIFAGTWGDGVFRSLDQGETWTQINAGLADLYINTLAVIRSRTNQSELFAGTNFGLFISTNDGANWIEADSGLTNMTLCSVASVDTVLVAGTWGDGIFRSTDNGKSWSQQSSMLAGKFITSIITCPTRDGSGRSGLFAATDNSGVFLSSDKGVTWTFVSGGIYGYIHSLAISVTPADTTLFVARDGIGVYCTANYGKKWTLKRTGLTNWSTMSFAMDRTPTDTTLILATWGSGVFLSHDNAANWTAVDTGLSDPYVWSICVGPSSGAGRYLFAGTNDHGIWRRPMSELAAEVRATVGENSKLFSLNQNYPNPFNPSTVISYQLPVNSQVTLKVYDVLGREVATLVNARQTPGEHSVTFDARNLPSGIYFYRISAGGYTATRKMLLVK
ncbi:MAG TPA: T9SS type A sorting domain-containing protein [Candidatus Acidoferrales bacterium]|nr:T9SS type A sorting domain-containing protein [Candidatus Acidoferrales bacterium]